MLLIHEALILDLIRLDLGQFSRISSHIMARQEKLLYLVDVWEHIYGGSQLNSVDLESFVGLGRQDLLLVKAYLLSHQMLVIYPVELGLRTVLLLDLSLTLNLWLLVEGLSRLDCVESIG